MATDCELVALLEDDTGMELLVCNKIISLDLPVSEIYKKIWVPEHGEASERVVQQGRDPAGEGPSGGGSGGGGPSGGGSQQGSVPAVEGPSGGGSQRARIPAGECPGCGGAQRGRVPVWGRVPAGEGPSA